jgi:endogenous inhibitor of DNA gyrase (YacG/DUF329 family)
MMDGTPAERALLKFWQEDARAFRARNAPAQTKHSLYGKVITSDHTAAHTLVEPYEERRVRIARETGKPLPRRQCDNCGKPFAPETPAAGSEISRYCSTRCAKMIYGRWWRRYRPTAARTAGNHG